MALNEKAARALVDALAWVHGPTMTSLAGAAEARTNSGVFGQSSAKPTPNQQCYGPPSGPPGVTAGEMAAQAKANAVQASQHSALNLNWFKNQVRDNGPWDYKRYDPAFQDFGNYNYGYTGEAQGIPARLLYDAAGLVQIVDHNSSPNWFWSNFDDPRDQEQIMHGISDRRNGC